MDASVEFLLDNLKQLVVYHVILTAGAGSELESLNNELGKFKAIHKHISTKYKKDELFKQWDREIRDVIYDIEDTIDECVTYMAAEAAKKNSGFKRLFRSRPASLLEAIKSIRKNKMQPLLKNVDFQVNFIAAEAHDTIVADVSEIRQKRSQNIVGFEKEAKDLIEFINGESNKLEIASIVGMAGLGKTTLTWKIFLDPRIKYEFPVRIWVNVSDNFNMKNVLLTILRKFIANPPDEPLEELKIKVKDHLKDGKFLIVMDDVWALDIWKEVKNILPEGNPMGRVLVTTRHENVALYSSTRGAHYLRFLTAKESWELLQYKVYGGLYTVHDDLKGIGEFIATDCDGLPLSIVVIGGILVEKTCRAENNVLAIKKEWEKVSTNMKPYLVDGDKKKLLLSIISLSYEKIPYEMRNCFLYIGVFPEDADIPVKELIRLWIAEGFILEHVSKSLEQVALGILKDLINRNLVMVKEKKHDGEPKICQIHVSVREFCKREANLENLNLFQEITSTSRGSESQNNAKKFRRLCVHSYVLDFLKKNKKVPKARSFLCFNSSTLILKPSDMAHVTDGFSLLRVYDAKNIIFPIFPQKFVQLLHLRYLTLTVEHCASLPEVISELWNLQTLIVYVSSRTLDISADIWKMRQLRHLKTKASISLKKDGRGEGGENLQTLSRLSPESCTNEVFRKAKNLITLGIQGELNKLGTFEFLEDLVSLHKLKLVNEVPNGVAAENPLRRLPDPQSFPPNLKILVLSGTYMQWSKMSILSMLGFLEVLILKENAFTGNYWEAVNIFYHLEHLQLERSTELVSWKASGLPFPKLKFLLLNNCEKLINVPAAVCVTLEKLSVERVTKDLVSAVEKIEEDKLKHGIPFKLDIAPGDVIQKS